MLNEPLPDALELLVMGGMTVDRFPDRGPAAGGSVLYAATAARDAGLRVGVVIAAGLEPEADAALRTLVAMTHLVVQRAPSSIGFEHRTVAGQRQLVLLEPGLQLEPGTFVDVPARAVLFASVAAEVPVRLVTASWSGAFRAAILQGWLRRLQPRRPVRPLALDELDPSVTAALGGLDLLVVSREDLGAGPDEPGLQLDALRRTFGPRPVLVLTDAGAGAWVDLPLPAGAGPRWHQPVPRLVEGVAGVGAGDMLAALLLTAAWPRRPDADWVRRRMGEAMLGVAERLEQRR
jgi:sugar/nucleoside kinase (ribokinase family)